jgi:hypothetical protein
MNYLVGKPEGTRPFGKHGGWWEDNIKMVLRIIDFEDIGPVTDHENTVMNLRVP